MAITVSGGFVGRSAELVRLLAAMERAGQGQPAMVLLGGDAGVGKTRLLVELADRARERGVQVLLGGCLEVGDVGLPYVPIVAALRGFAAEAGNDELLVGAAKGLAGLGSLLPELADQPTTPASMEKGLEQLQLFDSIRALLVRLSEGGPVLVVLEDFHWADRTTRDLLAFLLRTLHGSIVLVASYRSDALDRRHPLNSLLAELARQPGIERLELAPFGRADLAEHLAALAGRRLPASAVERIFVRSEGNPFYAEELLAAGADKADVRVPAALADVLLARVEVLSEPAQQLLRVMAVAGRRISHALLVAATGQPELHLEGRLREAVSAQLLVADAISDTYAFRHALLQEAVYDDLLPGERARLHATYAHLLAASGPAAELAHHCLASHNLPRALAALVRAAADASAVSAPAESCRHLTQALELWERVPEAAAVAGIDRADLLLRAAEAANQSGEFPRAVALTGEAVAAIDPSADPLRAALAHERLGHYVLEAEVELGWEQVEVQMPAACRRAVELVPAQPPTALRAQVAIGLARALAVTGANEEAERWAEEALATARAAGSAEDESHALATLGSLQLRRDNLKAARSLVRDAHRRATVTGNRPLELRAQVNLGTLELDAGNLEVACTTLDEAAVLAERSGLAWSSVGLDAQVLGGMAHYMAGDWDRAEQVAVAVDDRHPVAGLLSAVALFVEVGRGRANAEEQLVRLALFREADPFADYLAGGCEADLALWQGDLDRARTLVRRTLSAVDRFGEVRALSAIWPAALGLAAEANRAERALVAGDEPGVGEARALGRELVDRAQAAVRRARAFGGQVGPEALAWLARAEAERTRLESRSDPEAWRTAVDAFSYGYAYEVARCQWRLAETLLDAGDRAQATPAARAALQIAARLGAEPLRGALQALARRGRLDLGMSVPTEGRQAGLTPREQEVLQHLVEGQTNRQIARALFISEKTASVHVSNIMNKLGAANRSEAAAIARRLGLDKR